MSRVREPRKLISIRESSLRNRQYGIILMTSLFLVTAGVMIYREALHYQPCTGCTVPGEERPTMRHRPEVADVFISNFRKSPNKVVLETGWLINSKELQPFISGAEYVHLSLARIESTGSATTLVVSGVTQNYRTWHPIGRVGNANRAYVLETIHPCPRCFDLITDPWPNFQAAEQVGSAGVETRRQ